MIRQYRSYDYWLASLLTGFFLFRLAVMGLNGPGDSESYYYSWSRRLDLSYFDHPPLTAWLIRLFAELGGESLFMLRLPSALLFLLTAWLLYRLSHDLFGDDGRVGFVALLTFLLIPMFSIGALQMTPDLPAAACYIGFAWLTWRILETEGPAWRWYLLGATLGLGLLGKYFNVLLVPCLLSLFALVPDYRYWLRRKEPYLALLFAALLFSPVLIWNIQNDFASFAFHLTERHGAHQPFELRNFRRLFLGQALYVSPIFLILLLAAVVASFRRAQKGDRRYALLTAFSAPTLLFFYGVSAWTIESEPHWPAFGYLPATVAMGGLAVDGYYRWRPELYKRWRTLYVAGVALATLTFVLFYVHVFYPILPVKPKHDLVNELVGWDEVAKAISEEEKKEGRAGLFLLSSKWMVCSQLEFATRRAIPVACVNSRIDQFDFWQKEADFYGRPALVITTDKFNDPPEQLFLFSKVTKQKEMLIYRGGVEVKKITLWLGDDFGGWRGDKESEGEGNRGKEE